MLNFQLPSSRLSTARPIYSRRAALFATLLVFTWVLLSSARAGNKFWTGAGNGNFNNAGNWSGGTPVAGDDLIFQTTATRFVVTNDFSPNRAFNSLFFQGTNYFVRGNQILVTNGISSNNSGGANTIDADVDVRGSQFWEATGPTASLDINGDINLNANTLTVRANTGDFSFSGIVSGTGNLVKTNVGTLRLDGSGTNTYSGFTRFDGGVLDLAKSAGVTAIPGDLTIGDGNGLVGTDVLRLFADEQIANTADVTVKNSGTMNLQGNDEHIASLTMQGGTIDTGTGKLFLGGNLTTLSDTHTATINGHLSLGGASRTFDVNAGPPGDDLRINAVISSDNLSAFVATGFTKTGGGSLFLAGTNTYNGTTTINDGQVALLADRALGATTTPLGASAGVVVNASGNLFLSGVQVTNEDLTINSSNPGGAFNASGASVWTGDILLNTDTFIASSGSLFLNGQITGVGGFTKLSTGSLTLAGTNANTYTGTTTVKDGTLFLDKDTSVVLHGAMSGPLVIGEDELPENTDIVRWLRSTQLPDTTDITINASGLADLNGFGQNVRNIIFNGGDIDTGTGSVLPTGDITVNRNTNSQAIISGRMSVLSNPIIDVTGHNFSPDLKIDAQLFGAGGLTKNGVGEVSLTASNSYTGLTTVNDGYLEVDNSFALGTTAGGAVVNSGATLALRFNSHVAGEALTMAGIGDGFFGALSSSFGSNSWSGNVTLSAGTTVYVDSGDFLNLSGAVGGGFNLIKTGSGTLLFSGGTANTFNNLTVNAGTLQLNKSVANAAFSGNLSIGDGAGTDTVRLLTDNQIPDSSSVTMTSGAVFDLNDQSEQTGSISGGGQLDLGNGILRAGTDNGSASFNGLIVGTGQLFKLGAGTWTLNGNNTYSGHTTVSAGTLAVNGSQPASDVTVNGTATLGGAGVVGDLDVFGNLRPGSSPAILTTSNLLFNTTSTPDFFVELNGITAGTGYDQVKVRGSVTLSNVTLHATLGFQSAISNSFTIIDNDGADAVLGTFIGLAQNATLNINGIPFRINYTGGTGNDVVLTQLLGVPALKIGSVDATKVVLSWPSNYTGFTLESNTNLLANTWSVVSPSPVISGTNNVVTNSTIPFQRSYRLRNP